MSGSEYENHSPSSSPPSYEQRAAETTADTSDSKTGILSTVFSFVSREISEFVVNATGVAQKPSVARPVAGPSRERIEPEYKIENRHRRQSIPSQLRHDSRALKRVRRDTEDLSSNRPRRDRDVNVVDYGQLVDIDSPGLHSLLSVLETPEQSKYVSHTPPARCTRRKSVNMPGSLFSRSPTPDCHADTRHVRFASDIASPGPHRQRPVRQRISQVEPEEHYVESVQEEEEGEEGEEGEEQYEEHDSQSQSDEEYECHRSSDMSSPSCAAGNDSLLSHSQRSSAVAGPPAPVGDSTGNHSTIDEETAIERIRELEEKVRSLESELARRPLQRETGAPPLPPPPPPPPPLPLGSKSRIPLSSSPRRGPGVNSVLASLRAGLKTPNMPEPSKAIPKNRLPTVPADKMEEFLSELKTVKLRRVGSGNNLSQSTANSSSGLERSQSSSQGSSLMEDRPVIGYKRKRLNSKEAESAFITSMKRRFTVSSQTPAASTSSTGLFLPPPHPSTMAHLRSSMAMPAVPPEVDGTTPSLCSDNDNDAEDRAPSTPPSLPSKPGISRIPDRYGNQQSTCASASEEASVEVQGPRERPRGSEIRGLHSQALQRKQSIPSSPQLPTRDRSIPSTSAGGLISGRQLSRPAEDPFSCRPPSSPMLPETPRRPRPPGRVRSGSKPTARISIRSRSPSPPGGADDDHSLALSFAPPDASTPAPDPVGKRRPAQGQASRKQRRVTLDEEIRRVDPSYSDEERAMNKAEAQRRQSNYSDEERALNDLESGTLVGVGRRSRRLGFLAHGGAGGEPVLMGVGYVEGVVEEQAPGEQWTKETEVGKGKRKTRSNAGGKRKPKR